MRPGVEAHRLMHAVETDFVAQLAIFEAHLPAGRFSPGDPLDEPTVVPQAVGEANLSSTAPGASRFTNYTFDLGPPISFKATEVPNAKGARSPVRSAMLLELTSDLMSLDDFLLERCGGHEVLTPGLLREVEGTGRQKFDQETMDAVSRRVPEASFRLVQIERRHKTDAAGLEEVNVPAEGAVLRKLDDEIARSRQALDAIQQELVSGLSTGKDEGLSRTALLKELRGAKLLVRCMHSRMNMIERRHRGVPSDTARNWLVDASARDTVPRREHEQALAAAAHARLQDRAAHEAEVARLGTTIARLRAAAAAPAAPAAARPPAAPARPPRADDQSPWAMQRRSSEVRPDPSPCNPPNTA